MAEIHGVAGEWARVKGTVAGLWPMFLGTFAAGFTLSVACFRSVGWGATLFAVSLIGIGIALYRGLRHVERFANFIKQDGNLFLLICSHI